MLSGAPGCGFGPAFRGLVFCSDRVAGFIVTFFAFGVGAGRLAIGTVSFYCFTTAFAVGPYRGSGSFASRFYFGAWWLVFVCASVSCVCLVIRVCRIATDLINYLRFRGAQSIPRGARVSLRPKALRILLAFPRARTTGRPDGGLSTVDLRSRNPHPVGIRAPKNKGSSKDRFALGNDQNDNHNIDRLDTISPFRAPKIRVVVTLTNASS